MPEKIRRALFGWFFEASCIKHDNGYTQGGNELRRLVCDWKFFMAMLRDTAKTKNLTIVPKAGIAVSFFIAVRLGGWYKSFSYK